MTTDVLKVPGNYSLIAQAGGTILLDAGGPTTTGTVVVNGNLQVLGVQTTIESINATIKDNIIVLNSGEPGLSTGTSGISTNGGIAGISIDRGNADDYHTDALLMYDDNFNKNQSLTAINPLQGIWKLGRDGSNYGRVLETIAIFAPLATTSTLTSLLLLGQRNTTHYLTVGTYTRGIGLNYEDRISAVNDPDALVNKKYVDNLTNSAQYAKELLVGNSFVKLQDNSLPFIDPYYNAVPQLTVQLGTGTNSQVFELQGTSAKFSYLTLAANQIVLNTGTTATSIVLAPGIGNIVQMQSALQIQKTTAPASTASYTGLYSTSTVGGGGTGLFFVNTNNTDELVSRRRSIVYSIIF